VAEADRVRAEGDVDLADRQESVAETQRRAAETLRRNAELLQGTARELDRAGHAVRENRDDVRNVQQNAGALRAQTNQARDQVRETQVPRVDRGGDGSEPGIGRADGERAGNG
jgi:predicted ribosome quality control (RQC) complex YloA/Tae2 family protein